MKNSRRCSLSLSEKSPTDNRRKLASAVFIFPIKASCNRAHLGTITQTERSPQACLASINHTRIAKTRPALRRGLSAHLSEHRSRFDGQQVIRQHNRIAQQF